MIINRRQNFLRFLNYRQCFGGIAAVGINPGKFYQNLTAGILCIIFILNQLGSCGQNLFGPVEIVQTQLQLTETRQRKSFAFRVVIFVIKAGRFLIFLRRFIIFSGFPEIIAFLKNA